VSGASEREALAELASGWRGELLGVSLLVLDRCDSTQDVARRLLDRLAAEEKPPGPVLVVALEQHSGRGRRGRRWESPAGLGLWASLLLAVERRDLESLPARVAVALARALFRWLPGLRIKWPNDLVCDGRKLGGVLIEVVSRGENGSWAIIGFGIDRGPGEVGPAGQSTTLHELLGAEASPSLAALLVACGEALRSELAAPAGGWLERYRDLSAHAPGEELCVVLGEGRIAGRFGGLDERGALRLRIGGEERVVTSGDVFQW